MRPYLRVSDDKKGTSGSVEEQLDELENDAEEQAWSVGDSYADDGISASKYGVKTRGDFARLIADLQSGAFGATILGVWETSRFSRQMGEWLPALDAMTAQGVRVWSSVDHRLYDPRIAVDRKTLLTGAVDAEYESAKTSSRVLRTVRKAAASGKPHGLAKWGYRRIYDPITRELVTTEIVPSEADVIRTLHRRLLAGDSMRTIARDFEEQGVRSRTGKVLSAQVLREWALSPTYAGLRSHQPKRKPGEPKASQPAAELSEAKWPAIVERPTWERVKRLLGDPARKTRRDGLGRHLLSFLALCGVCGGPMSTSQREGQGGWHYRCHNRSCVQVNEELLDRVVEARVLEELRKPWRAELAEAQEANDPDLKRVRDELADVDRQLRQIGEALGQRRISVANAAIAEPPLLADRARLAMRELELLIPPELLDLEQRREQIVAEWHDSTMAAKRRTVDILMRYHLGELRIVKEPTGPWCRDESHARPERTCAHQVAKRLEWSKLVAPLPTTPDGQPLTPTS
jgi:DNA invertase Pin-like site-specific DNA recombinase